MPKAKTWWTWLERQVLRPIPQGIVLDAQLPLDPIGLNRRLQATVMREIREEAWILRLYRGIVILIIGLVNIVGLAWPVAKWQTWHGSKRRVFG
jgi:hypothetical protein